ncbi:MAG TPA: PEP/pyruvate-binding domain-containing protein [Candidatus Sulfomarinibacteraceae bacterium]|nr:PEP/pyruvate-binding domain-containing protein [Candidatus Sulfomarinibacteraceae bacterium]
MDPVGSLRRLFERLTGRRRPELSPAEAERLTTLFQERYHSFRQLLAANGKALDAMAVLEHAAAGHRPFGMDLVVSHATSVTVQVYQMIRYLDALAPDTYGELYGRFDEIRGRLETVLDRSGGRVEGPLVRPLAELGGDDAAVVGAKMANLGEARNRLGLRVPSGFVITAAAFERLLEHNDLAPEIRRLIQATEIERSDALFALSSRIQQLIASAEVPAEIRDAVDGAVAEVLAEAGGPVGLAVRSSALGEDSAETSFAGLYRSQLNVHPVNVLAAYLEVAASTYTPQAMVYRRLHGLRDEDVEMAVGCMAMVDASAGGVAYTADPQDGSDRRVRISAAIGLPKAVVDGRFDADAFVIDREDLAIVERQIVDQGTAFVLRPGEGIDRRRLAPDQAERPALSDDQVVAVARLALELESHFGQPQDVEWALGGDGELVVLQCRPLRRARVVEGGPAIDGEPLVRGGVCASPGVAGGPVAWVRSDREALKMPDGAVLVVDVPDPRWAALLDRAAAVVAEHGGIAGHLATVAREIGVPALFGVGSLAALHRSDEVTVDADGRAVHAGRFPEVEAARAGERRDLMTGSPIRRTLEEALALIAPLNLTDPSSTEFRPANVRTLHDITRFCHEQAVREMFAFGRDHAFPRYAAKQLHHNVPMQWWVLNLDDGFTDEVTGRYVRLDDIACEPMHALWQGMVAVPWEGPPALSGAGMASVLFEATRNPALSTPFRKPYAQRNYFMVSRSFMNLQSRFGFHFSSVETLAGERDSENYLVFSLKGGAADLERRAARARLVADIVEARGFEVKVIEDTITARVAAAPQDTVLQHIRTVGYLLMHTRQLDMVMGDPRSVERYRAKLSTDIDGLGKG